MRIAIGALAGCVLLFGCSGGGGGGGGNDHEDAGIAGDAPDALVGTLSIGASPRLAVIDRTGKAQPVKLTATLTTPDGNHYDITRQTQFSIDPAYGTFAGNLLHMKAGGKTTVTGKYAGQLAIVDVAARATLVRVDPSLPADIEAVFQGTGDAAKAPQIVYPSVPLAPQDDAGVRPRNLGDFEIHWTDAHSHDVFEISLKGEFGHVYAYVQGGNGLPAKGPMSSWNRFLPAEWEAAVKQASTVTFQVRGSTRSAPGTLGAGPAYTVRLTNEAMEGGLYYWANATAGTAIGIFRHDLSKPGQPAEEYLTTAKTGDRCIACHVLSRDGTKMAITYQDKTSDGTGLLPPGPATTVDVQTTTIATQTQRWNFATFTPDNKQLLSVHNGKLVVRDAATHVELAEMVTTPFPSVSDRVTHPDLSPDGKQLVYVRIGLTNTDFDFKQGQLFKRSYDPATMVFGPEVQVVSDGKNNFYPSWSPDGAWILFSRNEFGNAYDDSQTSVWVVKADGTSLIQLARANQALGLTNSWARWAPFAQTEGAGKNPLYWITFSSKRDFGARLINTGLAQRAKRAQLWMTPFFSAQAAQGKDPSEPVFRVPFQNLESSNHIAQWTQKVVEVIQ